MRRIEITSEDVGWLWAARVHVSNESNYVTTKCERLGVVCASCRFSALLAVGTDAMVIAGVSMLANGIFFGRTLVVSSCCRAV